MYARHKKRDRERKVRWQAWGSIVIMPPLASGSVGIGSGMFDSMVLDAKLGKAAMTDGVLARGKDALAFIPSYNDFKFVPSIVEKLRNVLPEISILVIDDGSTDAPGFIADDLDISFVSLPANFGLGACTHIAFDLAQTREFKYLLRIDSDDQHPAEDCARLLEPLANGLSDIVIGTRSNRGESSGIDGWLRRLITRYFSRVAKIVTDGMAPSDVNTGFFALNSKAISNLNACRLERYPEPQMFILAARSGLRMQEIEVSQRPRESGRSTLGLLSAARFFYRFNVFVLGEMLKGRTP